MKRPVGRTGLRALVLVAGCIGPAAAAEPPPSPDAAWSAAFAGISARLCGGFATDPEAIRDSGGLYDPSLLAWAEDGPALLAFRDGGRAAERAFGTEPLFCADPAAAAGSHQLLTRRVLVRKPQPGG